MIREIIYNPYRILGVYSNSSNEEQVSNIEKLLAFLKINKSFTFPLDLPHLLPPITRTEEMINEARAKLASPEERAKYALFWFIKRTAFDEIAFNHLMAGNVKKAKEIWTKVSTMSALQNLFVLELICADITKVVMDPIIFEYRDPNIWDSKFKELEEQGLFGSYTDAINKYAIPLFNKGYAETLIAMVSDGYPVPLSDCKHYIINTIKDNNCYVNKDEILDSEWAKHFLPKVLPHKKKPTVTAQNTTQEPLKKSENQSTIDTTVTKKPSVRISADDLMPPSYSRGIDYSVEKSDKPKFGYLFGFLAIVVIGLAALIGYFVVQSNNADNKRLRECEAQGGVMALNELANQASTTDLGQKAKARVEQICDSLYNIASNENTVEAWSNYRASVPENYFSDTYFKMLEVVFNDEETAWNFAESEKTIDLYEEYLKHFPDGKHHALADKRIIDLQVSDIFAGEHGTLPAMAKTGGGGSTSRIHIKNNTSYTLTVLYSGNDSKRLVLSPQQSSNVSLPNGTYKIAASVNASNVRSFAGSESLTGGSYDVEYYISYGGTYSSYN